MMPTAAQKPKHTCFFERLTSASIFAVSALEVLARPRFLARAASRFALPVPTALATCDPFLALVAFSLIDSFFGIDLLPLPPPAAAAKNSFETR